ncbi:MAG: hypothetical protein L7T24_01610 [Luminiphilus sp.]|nr:hypothetical protein [Luminiphilus sp.]
MTWAQRAAGLLLMGMCVLSFIGAHADPIARMSDKQVKELAKTLAKQEKAVEKALPSKFKKSVLRGPSGELMVRDYFSDLGDAIDHLYERFTGQYSASAEATEILTRSSVMHQYFQDNPDVKGVNEWDVYAGSLQQLAGAYGEEFPLGDDPAVRRIGDQELAEAAQDAAGFAKDFDSVLYKGSKKVSELKDDVKAARAELKTLASASKALSSNIKKGRPATAEAKQVMQAVDAIEEVLDDEAMPEEVVDAWDAGQTPINKIAQAFSL